MLAPKRRDRRHNLGTMAKAAIANLNRLRGPRGTDQRAEIYGDVHGSIDSSGGLVGASSTPGSTVREARDHEG